MNSTEIAYIYSLLDPRDKKVKYIGKTVNPKNRLSSHISESKSNDHHRARWIRSLIRKNLKPILSILKICPLCEFEKFETEYIKIHKSKDLTNSDETGQGNSGRNQKIIDRASKKTSKEVYQYDLDGNYIGKYKSVREASRRLNISHSNISRCCNNIFKHVNSYIFKYEMLENVEPVIFPNAVKKKISEIDIDGNIIETWDSIMDCSRKTGLDNSCISRVCSMKIRSIKNRRFIFL